jgi:nucleotide-binding universal stress UspA family protein
MNAYPTRDGPILIAVDFSEDSKAALTWGFEEAVKWGAPVIVLHVVHDPLDAPGYYHKTPKAAVRPLDDVAREMMEAFLDAALSDNPNFKAVQELGFETRLITGIPASRIIEFAETIGASLIVMGSRGQTGLTHLLLGSKAERVVQLSKIPVTIVKARKEDD